MTLLIKKIKFTFWSNVPLRRRAGVRQMSNVQRKSKGFSLIEFVIYTAIIALVILFLFEFLTGIVINQSRAKAREAVITNATTAINVIDFEIRHANAIYDATSTFGVSPGQLSLNTTQNLPNDETGTYVDIYLDSNQRLCIKRESVGAQCVTSDKVNIIRLQFIKTTLQGGAEGGVQTNITVEYDTNDADLNALFTLQSFARLRSY